MSDLKERILEDDYQLYWGYLYIVNGKPFKNLPDFKTVGEMRNKLVSLGIEELPVEIKSCDIAGRELWEHMT